MPLLCAGRGRHLIHKRPDDIEVVLSSHQKDRVMIRTRNHINVFDRCRGFIIKVFSVGQGNDMVMFRMNNKGRAAV